MSLEFVNEKSLAKDGRLIIYDNTCDSEVEESDDDIDFHPLDEDESSDESEYDSDDDKPLAALAGDCGDDDVKSTDGNVGTANNTDNSENDADNSENDADMSDSSKNINKKKTRTYRWRTSEVDSIQQNTAFADVRPMPDITQCETFLHYFKQFFDDEMICSIAEQTNLYSAQCNISKGSIGTDKDEVERYIGILLMMAIIHAPYYRYYWESSTRYEPIASVMSRDRFEVMKRFLHFNDKTKNKMMKTGTVCLKLGPFSKN